MRTSTSKYVRIESIKLQDLLKMAKGDFGIYLLNTEVLPFVLQRKKFSNAVHSAATKLGRRVGVQIILLSGQDNDTDCVPFQKAVQVTLVN